MIAAAILDRLLHHSQVLNIRGESYRLKDKRQAGLLTSTAEKTQTEVPRGNDLLRDFFQPALKLKSILWRGGEQGARAYRFCISKQTFKYL